MLLTVSLSDASLDRACGDLRRGRIDRWLNQWIADVQKYTPGTGLKSASAAYQKRYRDRLTVREEREAEADEYPATSLVATEYDFFAGLDYDALLFDGEGPGSVILKFTGDDAGTGNPLNQRLYYSFFSTTKFGDGLMFPDAQGRMDRFIAAFGKPLETTPKPDGVTARWVEGAKERVVIIENSGMISVEQSALSLKEAYHDAAAHNLNEQKSRQLVQDLF